MNKKQFYVILCNRKELRYLGFNNKRNKRYKSSQIVHTGQTDSHQISNALYFVDEQHANEVLNLYAESGKMNEKYVGSLKLNIIYLPEEVYNNLITVNIDLNSNALIRKDTYNDFCNH